MVPDAAFTGVFTVMLVEVLEMICAFAFPENTTESTTLNAVPEITTFVNPTLPEVGLKLLIDGSGFTTALVCFRKLWQPWASIQVAK